MGRNVAASQDRLTEDYRTFTAALDAVEARYVDKVESDRIVYGAISGMLQTLDPHSNFMDPQQYAQLRERQEGRYYGLGITIGVVDGDITVVSLFEGSPAYKLGIRRGDIIAKIDGEDAKGWKTDQAVRKLRGPKGTSVEVSLKRPGSEGLINVQVVRDEINIPTIPAEFMLDAQTGYVRLQDFAENTDRDRGREAPGARHPEQPGWAPGSGDSRGQPLPEEGRPDRLHARPGAELCPGFPGDRGE